MPALQLSCVPFTSVRFVARSIVEIGENRVREDDAHRDAQRMVREGFSAEVLRVEWEPVTGLKRGARVLRSYTAS